MKTLSALLIILFLAGCNDQGGVKEPEDVGEELTGDTSHLKDSSDWVVVASGVHDSLGIVIPPPKVDSFEIKLQALLKRIEYGNEVGNNITLAQAYRDNYEETGDESWLAKSQKSQKKARYWVRKYDSISHALHLPGNKGNLH